MLFYMNPNLYERAGFEIKCLGYEIAISWTKGFGDFK